MLRGVAGDALLNTYQQERLPHARDWTVISLEAGKIPCTLDPEIARERDEKLRAGWRPPMLDFPKLETGVLNPNGREHAPALVGQLALQGRADHEGTVDLFDAVFQPKGFTVVSTVADPRSVLSAAQLRGLERLQTTFAHIGAPGTSGADAADVDGTYRDYLDRHGIAAVVARPDFYVFGAARRIDDLPALVDRLLPQTGGGDSMASAPHDAQACIPFSAASR